MKNLKSEIKINENLVWTDLYPRDLVEVILYGKKICYIKRSSWVSLSHKTSIYSKLASYYEMIKYWTFNRVIGQD